MRLLNNLIQTKPKNDSILSSTNLEEQKVTYHKDGYDRSKSCQGRSENLKGALEAIYYRFENDCKTKTAEQDKLKQPYVSELKGKNTSLLNKNEDLEKLASEHDVKNTRIEKLKQDIINVKRKPLDYGLEVSRKASARFWIGLIFLLPLSVYIFIFYVSTSYSGFFRNFNPSVDIFGGMFYPRALQEAYNDGILEIGFIVFIPFVFFGLGFLIHMFQSKKGLLNKVKMGLLFVITFIFDAILAYLIDGKLYSLNKRFEDPDFSVAIASVSASFWVIIFAGFVSYIIWGLVFDFVMKEHSDRDKVQSFINGIKNEIENKEKGQLKIKERVECIEKEMSEIKKRASELDSIIDGFILPIFNYKALAAEFLQGWQEYISAELAMGYNEKGNYLQDVRVIYDEHIAKLDLDTDSYQNKVYRRVV